MSLPAQVKRNAIRSILNRESSVTEVSKKLSVARKTIYHWIRSYKETPSSAIANSLEKKYVKGKAHPRAVYPEARNKLIKLIIKHPEWGSRKYSSELKLKGINFGYFGVFKLLQSLGVSTYELRKNFRRNYAGPGRLSADIKLSAVKKVLEDKENISKIAQEHTVARKTIYQWINKYQNNTSKGITGEQALKDSYVRGDNHPFAIYPQLQPRILGIISKKPTLSIHQLSKIVDASSYSVWKILDKYGLNSYQKRYLYAQSVEPTIRPSTPLTLADRVRLVWNQFVTNLAPAPPPVFTTIWRFANAFIIASLASFAIVFSSLWWLDYITTKAFSIALGTVFASVALLMGSVFFLYSLKYYLSLAIVLSFSQQEASSGERLGYRKKRGLLSWILGLGNGRINGKWKMENGKSGPVGLTPNLEHIRLKRHPKISIHVPLYNEKNVVERLLTAVSSFDYPLTGSGQASGYEVIIADDSTDETTEIVKRFLKVNYGQLRIIKDDEGTEIYKTPPIPNKPSFTLLHRASRSGFKGGALRLALSVTDPQAEFISVFDADFVPYPDTLELFLKYFKVQNSLSEDYSQSKVAAVQGYQWHVLNKSENWITRGVRSEYAGSYVIERSGAEIYTGLKQISGSVYMIRKDVLEEVGWETSITEDFQLTLKLYEKGYKVVYTPYIQAPAECVSTLKRLIRQRMRWAEGHSNNVRKMFTRLLFGHWIDSNVVNDQLLISNYSKQAPSLKSQLGQLGIRSIRNSHDGQRIFVKSPLTISEKLEFLYLSPYYLQAFFFLLGTLSWLVSETLFPARLPFWTSLWGWSLVLTNFLSLPLMNAVGLFLEESEEKDYQGLFSFVILSYVLVPFQAYAAVKGFLERAEGPWFRTPKTGRITDIIRRGTFYRLIAGILPGRVAPATARIQANAAVSLKQMKANERILAHSNKFAFNSLSFASSPYLGLATANNKFDSFKLTPRRMRWVGKSVLAIFLAISISLVSFSPLIDSKNSPLFRFKEGELKVEKHNFEINEEPVFTLDKSQLEKARHILSLTSDVQAQEKDASEDIQASLYYQGKKLNIPIDKEEVLEDKLKFTPKPDGYVRPGRYEIRAVVGKGEEKVSFSSDFTWGVLAINTNKSIYKKDEQAYIQMAVLSDEGHTVCGAPLSLSITDPEGRISNPKVSTSGLCLGDNFTEKPDYFSYLRVKLPGTYQMKLTRLDTDYQISDSFEVREEVDFEIERLGPTRIYPPSTYDMRIIIKANKDFNGEIIEGLPEKFGITSVSGGGRETSEGTDSKTKHLFWNVVLKKGETLELDYSFRAPRLSPEFYYLGPLVLIDSSLAESAFKEARKWQIAADAIAHEEADTGTIESATATITSVTTSTNTTAVSGHFYLAAVSTKPNKTIDSVSGLGLTWTKVDEQCGNRSATNMAVFKSSGNPTGDGTVTANLAGGTAYKGAAAIAVHRYSGVDTSNPVGNTDKANTAGVGAAAVCDDTQVDTNTYSFSTLDTQQADSVVFSAVSIRSRTHTAGTNYVERADVRSGTSGDSAGVATQDQTFATATTNLTVDGSFSSTVDWGVVAVEILIVPEYTWLFFGLGPFLPFVVGKLRRKRA